VCGICGSLDLEMQPVDPGEVRPMLAAMVHRGPDSEGLLQAPGLTAGIRRLAVIDPAGGTQPIANEDGSVEVVFNGEIYNFAELRGDLETRGHRFRTRSDTEVLVHLWEEHGPDLVHRLNGMFALCLHDRRQRRTFVARDRLGIKPLYYKLDGTRLMFASELAVLLAHPAISGDIDPAALIELFCLQYVSGERTLYRDIVKLPPGGALDIVDGVVKPIRWWTVPNEEPLPLGAGGLDARLEELRALLDSSVRYRTVADVPLGMFLSGGLDSSAIAAILSGQSKHPVQSFSVGFADQAAFDEREHARAVAEAFGAEHHELVVSAVDIAEHLPELIAHLAMPVTDPAILPTWMLSEFARRKVTVALSGEGADELFAGYRRYVYQDRLGWLGKVPGSRAVRGLLPRRIEQALEAVGEDRPARNHLLWSATVGLSLATRLFEPDAARAATDRAVAEFEPYFPTDRVRLRDQLAADQGQWLPHNLLAKVDRASMAHSLEARVPFLDHRVVEWAARQPDDLKLRGKTTKFVLREAFRGTLPESTTTRSKQGFDLPLAAWIRGPLRSLAEQAVDASGLWPELRADRARSMLDEHLAGSQDHGLPLFLLVSVLTFLEGRR
jgi:asparagine synthase (glutamine-hydrolysing)